MPTDLMSLLSRTRPCFAFSNLLFLAATPLFAVETGDENLPDKGAYSIFNPTPDSLLRELSPDRPDTTESPITVDAGHYAAEVSFFDWRKDSGDTSYTVMAANLKVGLSENTDLQFVFNSYQNEVDGSEGFGDIQLRLKWNLWGNDGGNTALAVFPYVKIPTGTAVSNDHWEGGLILPYAVGLTDTLGLGLMAEVDVVWDEDSSNHKFEFLHSAVLGLDLTEKLGAFSEYIGIISEGSYQAFSANGFTYAMTPTFIFDIGTQVGLNNNSADFGAFAGFTTRF